MFPRILAVSAVNLNFLCRCSHKIYNSRVSRTWFCLDSLPTQCPISLSESSSETRSYGLLLPSSCFAYPEWAPWRKQNVVGKIPLEGLLLISNWPLCEKF